jgi:hypothetical protein
VGKVFGYLGYGVFEQSFRWGLGEERVSTREERLIMEEVDLNYDTPSAAQQQQQQRLEILVISQTLSIYI